MYGPRAEEDAFKLGLDRRQHGFPPRSKSTPLERFPPITRAESGDGLSDGDDYDAHGEAVAAAAPRRKQNDKGKNAQKNPYLNSLGKCRSETQISDYDRKLFANALPWIPTTKTWQMRMHGKEEKQMDRRVGSSRRRLFLALDILKYRM
jgi:hypothetical protein